MLKILICGCNWIWVKYYIPGKGIFVVLRSGNWTISWHCLLFHYCTPLSINVHNFPLLYTLLKYYTQLSISVHPYSILYTIVYYFTPLMYTIAHYCTPLFNSVHNYILLYTIAFSTNVHHCALLYTRVNTVNYHTVHYFTLLYTLHCTSLKCCTSLLLNCTLFVLCCTGCVGGWQATITVQWTVCTVYSK